MKETGKRDAVLVALAAGKTVREAAAETGVGERTAHRWLADPQFRAELANARQEMIRQAVGKLADASSAAADELRRLLTDAESDAVRLRAAVAILDGLTKLREHVELADRVAALENAFHESERSPAVA